MKQDFSNETPIYLQIVEKIKILIISGQILPGDRLPSVRDLALEMKVNPNTMQKALVELENLGLIYTERTNGKYATQNKKLIDKLKQEQSATLTTCYIESMSKLGYNLKEIIEQINKKGEKK